MVAISHGGKSDATEKRRHFAACPSFGKGFKQLAARIHQRHDIACEGFTENEGRRHRQRRNDIEPDIATAQRGDDLREQCEQNWKRSECPGETGRGGVAVRPDPAAGCEAKQRDTDQQARAKAPVSRADRQTCLNPVWWDC